VLAGVIRPFLYSTQARIQWLVLSNLPVEMEHLKAFVQLTGIIASLYNSYSVVFIMYIFVYCCAKCTYDAS